MVCPNCKGNDFGKLENKGAKFEICKNCGYIVQTQKSDEYDNFCKEQEIIREQENSGNKPVVECPYCHSLDTKKITATSKAIHTAVFGIFSLSRNSKQWHCNQCNSDF